MGSQVISFLRSTYRSPDWTREELAELYRIEHALVQSRLSLETDRGLTDEGDPWFVFCRSDGEVLVHIARFDGEYRLYSPGLPEPLVGRSFALLSKSFVHQIPLQVPVKRNDGLQLFVHPAAMLAVIIGTIFVASDDVYLFSAVAKDADGNSERSSEAVHADRNSLKTTLQNAFHKYMEGFLSGTRSEAVSHESSYLNIISTIAAFVVGSTLALTSDQPSAELALVSAANASEQASADAARAVQLASNDGDFVWRADSSDARADRAHMSEIAVSATQQESGQSEQSNAHFALLSPEVVPPELVASGSKVAQGADGGANVTALSSEDIAASQHSKSAAIDLNVIQVHATNVSSSSTSPEISIGSGAATAALVHSAGAANTSVDDLFHHAIGVNSLLAIEYQTLIARVLSVNDPSHASSLASTSQASGNHYAMYDAAAQATLTAFLHANPGYQVFFDRESVIVYDGHHDTPGALTVQVWEFDTGATIAIVGHANQPYHI